MSVLGWSLEDTLKLMFFDSQLKTILFHNEITMLSVNWRGFEKPWKVFYLSYVGENQEIC